MTFRASNVTPAIAYATVRVAAVNLKLNAQGAVSAMAAGNTDYDYLRGIYRTLFNVDAQFTSLGATPGLEQYAKDQENDAGYDVAAEFVAMQATITAAMAWMDANVPTDVTAKTPANWGDGGTIISDTFTPAQTSGLQTALTAIASAIS